MLHRPLEGETGVSVLFRTPVPKSLRRSSSCDLGAKSSSCPASDGVGDENTSEDDECSCSRGVLAVDGVGRRGERTFHCGLRSALLLLLATVDNRGGSSNTNTRPPAAAAVDGGFTGEAVQDETLDFACGHNKQASTTAK